MLEVKNLNVYYGAIHALQGISFHVDEGEIVTLIGANGAGKSTTLRTISGLLRPRTGTVQLPGAGHHHAARRSRSSGWASARCRRGARSSRPSPCGRTC